MSWREIDQSDLAWVEAFLREHMQSSMFFLSNLVEHGLNSQAVRAMRIWALGDGRKGLFALSNGGMILMQAPDATEDDWRAAAELCKGRALIGCLGEGDQVAAFFAATGLGERPMSLNEREPGYRLDLALMVMPECDGFALVPLDETHRALAITWRAVYHGEVLGTPEHKCVEIAARDIAGCIERDSHRILLKDGVPVAMTGFNATLPDTVQIGGVFTPSEARGQGLARRALALHLQEARDEGVTTAILFAANEAAARAYEAIGFQRDGTFSLMLFADEEEMV
ncbi:GNAT family N-acetyltransferase [Shimia sp. MMG029]|uniref:GNAT family N-acetyltransferase n=1 Tax=Shimia sp. MMG029 TaxID=3021978 RepID=UPI0022FEF4CB|nr:GNAT family N-acetyltransferase [Shimia sp. MMG029]MDA5558031.1 GNAT family N-acetyltransferase [Shimia sp. MMG029]